MYLKFSSDDWNSIKQVNLYNIYKVYKKSFWFQGTQYLKSLFNSYDQSTSKLFYTEQNFPFSILAL